MRQVRIGLRLLLALLSTGVAFVCAEVVARTFDPMGVAYFREVPRYFAGAITPAPPGPDGLPPADGRLFQQLPGVVIECHDFDFITNQAGVRDSDPDATVPARVGQPTPGEGAWSKERWLMLGDSVTLAWGVDDDESWPRLVEREARATDGRPLEVLNAGHLMYETVQQADLLRVLGPQLRPEVVALTFISNDFQPTYDELLQQIELQTEAVAARKRSSAPERLWFRISSRFEALSGLLRFAREQRQDPLDPNGDQSPMRFYPKNWPRCRDALDAIVAGCELLGARFVLIDHTMPAIPELPAWAEEHGVPYVRVGFEPHEYERGIVNSRADAHANALGNQIIATKVRGGLEELGWVQAP
ncbi:MAG: SGNH/GDSL hydrolase family protein [Planctomycetota bacterium]